MKIITHKISLMFIAMGMATGLCAQTFTDIGTTAPTPGANDISQLSTAGNTTWPDGINYFTDNNPPVGQTFTTGAEARNLTSLSIKTAGLNSGGGYGTPATTTNYYLRIYSISGSTATLLNTFSAPNPVFTDGDWLKWSGLNLPLAANQTYAFTFGIKPDNGGWAALAVATNAYAGGEIVAVPIGGGAITTGASHAFDAVFDLGLQRAGITIPDSMPLPVPTYGFNLGNSLEAVWGFTYPTAAPLNTAAAAGFNAVRIPVAWAYNSTTNISGGVTNYPINPTFMAKVKQTVDNAIAAGLYVVMNDHWDGGWLENNISTNVDPVINAKMKDYWTQIATAFAGYDNHLLFAGANEPNVNSPAEMTTLMFYYQTFVNAVRATGGNNTNRWLVIQSVSDPAWMNALPTDTVSNRLMVEYHNYSPSLFTIIHTDQTWGSAVYYWGPAYHYSGDPTRNATSGEEGSIDSYHQQLADLYVSKGIPVMIGEFGAYTASLTGTAATWNRDSTLYWDKYVAESARAHGLSPFYWSTPGSPIDFTSGAVNDAPVVTALTAGTVPPPPNGAPYAPSGLTVTGGVGQVNLSWTAGSGATSYKLYRATQSGSESSLAPIVTGITSTSYTDTNLTSGLTYYYQVVAVNGSGSSGFSPEVHATMSGVNPDPAQFNFETDVQGWYSGGGIISGIATSTAQHYGGNQSLAVNFNGAASGSSSVNVGNVGALPGVTITFRVWIPSGHMISSIQPYMQDHNWAWTSSWYGSFTPNAWNTLTLTVPQNAVAPLQVLGLQIATSAGWTGTCYIDSVSWTNPAPDFSLSANPTSLTLNAGANGTSTITVTSLNGLNACYTLSASGLPSGVTATFGANPITGGASIVTFTAANNVVSGTTNVTITATAGLISHTTTIALTVNGLTLPAAPLNLAATAGDSQVGLTWSASAGATSYNVKRATVNGGPYTTVANVTTTSFNNTGLANGTTYYYVVSAVNGGGESSNSSQVSATPQVPAPSAPTGLAATAGNAQVSLSWSASSGATSYNVKRATVNGGPYSSVANVTTTSFNNTGLANGTTYYYVVSAVNAGGESANSSQVSATPQVPPPATPTGLVATPGYLQMTLSWSAASGATSYNVKRATTSGGPYSTLANTASTGFVDNAVVMGTTYYYVVSAVNGGGESANSAQVSGTSLTLPSPWSTTDIGAVGIAGSAVYSNSTYTVTGSGADTWGTADQFRFVYQTGGTNCSITAKVLAVSNSNGSAKGGVMIRETLATNAVDCFVDVMPVNGLENIWRKTTGGTCSSVVKSGLKPPYWVRVTRSGSVLTGYSSSNGVAWTPISTNTITMANSVNIGLFVCSHNNSASCTATFTNVVVSP